MPLFNIEGKKQNTTGKSAHWKEFKSFQKSPLHQQIVNEISKIAKTSKNINSMYAGNSILSTIFRQKSSLIDSYNKLKLGSLFGMSLWNWLAMQKDDWYFYRDSKSTNEEITGMVYFQNKD